MPKSKHSTPKTRTIRPLTRYTVSIAFLCLVLAAASPPSPSQTRRPIAATAAPTAEPGGPGAGSLTSMAVDSSNPNILYAGTAHGGAYKSTDAGANWFAINSGFEASAAEFSNSVRLVIDPSNPSTLYAAFPGLYKTMMAGLTGLR